MLTSLEFDRAPTGVCSVRGNCIVTVVCPIQELGAFVVVEHAECHVFVGMYFAHIEGKPLVEEILSPVKDVHSEWLLRAATLEAVEIEARAKLIAQIELLAH